MRNSTRTECGDCGIQQEQEREGQRPGSAPRCWLNVAQICNLPYRRIASCKLSARSGVLESADALPITNRPACRSLGAGRRYGRARSSRNQCTPQRRDERGEGASSSHLCVRPVSAVYFLFREFAQGATILADTGRLKICATTMPAPVLIRSCAPRGRESVCRRKVE